MAALVCLFWILCTDKGYAQEVEPTILEGTPLIESINLFEISSYPQNWGITKDKAGNIFVGTGGAVMHFDGVKWNRYLTNGTGVFSVELGYDGKLYTGGADELGYFEKTGTRRVDTLRYTSLNPLVPEKNKDFGRVSKIIADQDSTLFFNAGQYSFQYQKDSLTSVNDDLWVFRLFQAHSKIITNDSLGISIYEGGELELIPGAEQFEYTGVNCLMETDNDGFIFQVRNEGLYHFDGNNFEKQDSEASDFLSDLLPYTCQKLQDDSYFIGTTTAGGIRFDEDGAILGLFNEDTGLPENVIYDSFLDIDGTLWLSHFDHISKLDFGEPIRQVHRNDNFEGMPHSIVIFEGEYYVSTDRGLYRLNENQREIEKISSTSIVSKLFVSDGELYLHTNRTLKKPLESEEPVLVTNDLINNIYPYEFNSSLYFTVSELGMTFLTNNGSTYTETSNVIDVNLRHAHIVENDDGDIWIGSITGNLISISASEIQRYMETGEIDFREYEMPEGWHRDRSRRIFPLLLNDDVLLGTPTGLYRIDEENNSVVEDNRLGEFSRINERGNPNSIHTMTADSEGNIWFRASREFQYAERQEDGSYVIHKNTLKRIQDDQNNDILPIENGKVWFAGSSGLIYYDHSLALDRTVRPPLIRTVTTGQDSLVFQSYDREETEYSELILPYGMNDIRIEYAFNDFSSFYGTEYRVKLEGFDGDWSIWSEETWKDYTQIREGSYRFMVQAKDVTGVVSEASVLSVQILPPWYRTFWSYLLYFALFSGMMYSIHKYRVRRILHVQNIRNKIAGDLHDDISATLSSISYFSEAIDRETDQEKSKRYLSLISKSANEAKENITDIIWSINPENDNWENLLTKCRRYAADLLESRGIEYEIEFQESISGKVDIELRKNLWLIFKEIVTNLVRHSKADYAKIEFTVREGKVYLKISDNGVGFVKDDANRTNGLKNIKMRADQLGFDAGLESSERGTTWTIQGSI